MISNGSDICNAYLGNDDVVLQILSENRLALLNGNTFPATGIIIKFNNVRSIDAVIDKLKLIRVGIIDNKESV